MRNWLIFSNRTQIVSLLSIPLSSNLLKRGAAVERQSSESKFEDTNLELNLEDLNRERLIYVVVYHHEY